MPRNPIENMVIRAAESILNDPSNPCTKALADAKLLDKVKAKLPGTNFVAGKPLKGSVSSNETAITSPNGASDFIRHWGGSADDRATEVDVYFFIHELTHHATGRTDTPLVILLGIPRVKGVSDSELLNGFFNPYSEKQCTIPARAKTPTKKKR